MTITGLFSRIRMTRDLRRAAATDNAQALANAEKAIYLAAEGAARQMGEKHSRGLTRAMQQVRAAFIAHTTFDPQLRDRDGERDLMTRTFTDSARQAAGTDKDLLDTRPRIRRTTLIAARVLLVAVESVFLFTTIRDLEDAQGYLNPSTFNAAFIALVTPLASVAAATSLAHRVREHRAGHPRSPGDMLRTVFATVVFALTVAVIGVVAHFRFAQMTSELGAAEFPVLAGVGLLLLLPLATLLLELASADERAAAHQLRTRIRDQHKREEQQEATDAETRYVRLATARDALTATIDATRQAMDGPYLAAEQIVTTARARHGRAQLPLPSRRPYEELLPQLVHAREVLDASPAPDPDTFKTELRHALGGLADAGTTGAETPAEAPVGSNGHQPATARLQLSTP